MTGAPSALLEWNDILGRFSSVWTGLPLVDLYPMTLAQRTGTEVILAEARPVNTAENLHKIRLQSYTMERQSDYVFRCGTRHILFFFSASF